ncbi:MAG TPA: HAD hydrolase-like protein [Streptosporangiaceae bacterium]|nr:HAD hydrolase-like protein [Streptosporangiaceae bacterium]
MDNATDSAGISLVCCGLIGTLVADDGLIERSFGEAIATQGVVAGTSAFARRMSQVHRARGMPPGDVLRVLFPDNEARAQAAELAFDRALPDSLSRADIRMLPGAVEALGDLRAAGRRVCVLTSLPRRVLNQVLDAANLRRHVDLALSTDDAPRGFPAPDLALAAMLQAGVAAVQDMALVHGTGAGMECGRRSGASVVVGVLTGAHSAARLRAAGATHIVSSIAEVPALLEKLDPRAERALGGENGTPSKDSVGAGAAGTAAAVSATIDVPPQATAERRRLGR